MKLVLLASVVAGIAATSARADDLATLKGEIDALNARIAQLETASIVPPEFRLLSVSQIETLPLLGEKASDHVGWTGKANAISVLPTADAPAAASVMWSGEIRTALTYRETDFEADPLTEFGFTFYVDAEDVNVNNRSRLSVRSAVDTAVGEVGVNIRLEGESEFGGGASVEMDRAYGWWKWTPEWEFSAGYNSSLGNTPYGQDGYVAFGNAVEFSPEDVEQFRLTYSSGPLAWGVAVEGSAITSKSYPSVDPALPSLAVSGDDLPAVSSRLTYTADAFSVALSGYYDGNGEGVVSRPGLSDSFDIPDTWQVAAGGTLEIGQSALISVAAAVGEGTLQSLGARLLNIPIPFSCCPEYFSNEYWGASVYGRLDLSETVFTEASFGYSALQLKGGETALLGKPNLPPFPIPIFDLDVIVANAGLYYSPVNELTIGLQADYTNFNISDTEGFYPYSDIDIVTASLVTWFRF